jgi:hypothetical protein
MPRRPYRLAPLDYLAIIAGIVNALVIFGILFYWFFGQ